MIRPLLLSCLFLLLTACAVTKKTNESIEISKNNIPELIVQKEIKIGNIAYFSFVNHSNQKITVHGPAFKNIEKFEGGNWRKVKIVYCPCGADCIPPPRTKLLMPGEKHDYNWNLMESWCDKRMKNNNKMTVENKSTPGLYRTTIYFSLDSLNQEQLIREFNIVY